MRLSGSQCRVFLATAVLSTVGAIGADAAIAILSPPDGQTKVADPCPFPVCTAHFPAQVAGHGRLRRLLEWVHHARRGPRITIPICQPPDPIEGTPGCAVPPVIIPSRPSLREGSWTVVARARPRRRSWRTRRRSDSRCCPRASLLPGPSRSRRSPRIAGAPSILARDPGPNYPIGIATAPGETTITGTNLDNNPFLDVYVSPIRSFEPPLASNSGLPRRRLVQVTPRGSWGAEPLPGGESFLRVELPDAAARGPDDLRVPPGTPGQHLHQGLALADPRPLDPARAAARLLGDPHAPGAALARRAALQDGEARLSVDRRLRVHQQADGSRGTTSS